MIFNIEKPKVPKGYSYVLKSSVLKDAIIANDIACNVHLVYWKPKQNEAFDYSLIDAWYWEPNQNVDDYRFYIRSGQVFSSERKKIEVILKDEVVPQLIGWMKSKTEQPANSTTNTGRFCAFYKDGRLVIEKD